MSVGRSYTSVRNGKPIKRPGRQNAAGISGRQNAAGISGRQNAAGRTVRVSLLALAVLIVSVLYVVDVKPQLAVAASEKASLQFLSISNLLSELYSNVELPKLRAVSGKNAESSLKAKGLAGVPALFRFDGLPVLERGLLHGVDLSSETLDSKHSVELDGQKYSLSLDPKLQSAAQGILMDYQVPFGAIVAIVPQTGEVLTLASHTKDMSRDYNVALEANYPAASLFKLVTAAAAIEAGGMDEQSTIKFHGGNHTLNKRNYLPDSRRDRRQMSLQTAFGKSVNAAFARIGVGTLSPSVLSSYAESFGFNKNLTFELLPDGSRFDTPDDEYEMAMTAAGFQNAKISPLHAAVLAATVANGGVMMKPYLVDSIEATEGDFLYQSSPKSLGRVVLSSTAKTLTNIMRNTVSRGTARRHFRRSRILRNIQIAGKTGTLSGDSPKGRYHWFIALAPADKPEIAIATLVIDQGSARVNGVGLGRLYLEKFFSKG